MYTFRYLEIDAAELGLGRHDDALLLDLKQLETAHGGAMWRRDTRAMRRDMTGSLVVVKREARSIYRG
jgi:hypothetical protein